MFMSESCDDHRAGDDAVPPLILREYEEGQTVPRRGFRLLRLRVALGLGVQWALLYGPCCRGESP